MPIEPFCFVHATSLQLDQPLTGTGTLTGSDRQLAEDAPLIALARIVDACIEQQAAFLLLTGNSFDFTDHHVPLASRVAVDTAFERLAEHDIRVFIVPGVTDAPAAWKRLFRIPANVTTFFRDDVEPAPVVRHGRTLCAVLPVVTPHVDNSRWTAQGPAVLRRAAESPFVIGLVGAGSDVGWEDDEDWSLLSSTAGELVRAAINGGVNYLAMGHGMTRRSRDIPGGVAHDPGSPQGRIPSEIGPRGCTLVNVDAGGGIHTRLLPTAPVRFEAQAVEVDRQTTWDVLVERMQLAVMESEAQPGEELCVWRWTIRGEGDLYDALAEGSARQDLWELVEQELGDSGPRRVHHLLRTPRPAESVEEDAIAALRTEFVENINADLVEQVAQFRRSMSSQDWGDSEWAKIVVRSVDRLQAGNVGHKACEMGIEWLS